MASYLISGVLAALAWVGLFMVTKMCVGYIAHRRGARRDNPERESTDIEDGVWHDVSEVEGSPADPAEAKANRPPPRVRVDVVTTGGQNEVRIVYRWWSIPRFLFGLLLAAAGFISYSVRIEEVFGVILSMGTMILGAGVVLLALFGKGVVKLQARKGVCTSCFDWKEFPLSPCTQVQVIKREANKETLWRDILVTDDSLGEIRFGWFFPERVQDYICICIANWTKGMPLVSCRGPIFDFDFAHSIWSVFFVILTVGAVIFSTSWERRVVVRNGAVELVDSTLWGRRKSVKKIQTNDVVRVEFDWIPRSGYRHACGGYWQLAIRHKHEAIAKPFPFDRGARGAPPTMRDFGRVRAPCGPLRGGFAITSHDQSMRERSACRSESEGRLEVWTYHSKSEGLEYESRLEKVLRDSGELNPCRFKYGFLHYGAPLICISLILCLWSMWSHSGRQDRKRAEQENG